MRPHATSIQLTIGVGIVFMCKNIRGSNDGPGRRSQPSKLILYEKNGDGLFAFSKSVESTGMAPHRPIFPIPSQTLSA